MAFAPFPIAGKIRPVLPGPDGQFLVDVIHQPAIFVQQIGKRLPFEAPDPGLQRQFRILAAYIDRIVLYAPGLPDILICTVFPDKTVCTCQSLFRQNKLPCLLFRNRFHIRISFILPYDLIREMNLSLLSRLYIGNSGFMIIDIILVLCCTGSRPGLDAKEIPSVFGGPEYKIRKIREADTDSLFFILVFQGDHR